MNTTPLWLYELQRLGAEARAQAEADALAKRAEHAGCKVTRVLDEVVIEAPPGIDLRALHLGRLV